MCHIRVIGCWITAIAKRFGTDVDRTSGGIKSFEVAPWRA